MGTTGLRAALDRWLGVFAIFSVFRRRRVGWQLPLGFASGLPLLLTGTTLTAWMTTAHVDLKTIGLFAVVSLPYSLKFLWAPLLDRYALAALPLGRRRGWMLITQLLVAAAIFALGAVDPRAAPGRTALLAVVLAFVSASHDIVIDAYRADLLSAEERAAGTAVFIAGYRLAMIVAGGLALVLAAHTPWRTVYHVMAAAALVGPLTTLLAPEPTGAAAAPRSLAVAIVHPFRELFGRPRAGAILAFVAAFRLGHLLLTAMSGPFLLRGLGFRVDEVGAVQKLLGLALLLAGGLFAGAAVARLGTRRSLVVFGTLQLATHLGFLALALIGKSHAWLIVAVGIDALVSGLSIAPFDAYLMSLCDRRYSATQFALLTSLSTLSQRTLGAGAGALAAALGWPGFFLATLVLALPGLALIRVLPDDRVLPDEPVLQTNRT